MEISVIMGIYNCENTLPDAINSIINQTFSDWELIMCDDGSCDDTYAVAERYLKLYPSKMVLLKNETNLGLNATLNNCLDIARGEYIARMDGDDLCSPERFEIEINFLKQNPEFAIISTDMTFFDETGTWGLIRHPDCPEYKDFLHESPFCHASCMVRKDAIRAVGGYSVNKMLLRVEDYDLWMKLYAAGYKGYNIHQPLYQMRDDRNAYVRRKFRYRINESYVKITAIKKFKLPVYNCIFVIRPIIVGLMPLFIYDILHKKRLKPYKRG